VPLVVGEVASFDEHGGWGTVVATGPGGGRRYPFHCTAVADGSRHIAPGTPVVFGVVAGHHGRWEATDVAGLVSAERG
jgi:cold shock CspA family protein